MVLLSSSINCEREINRLFFRKKSRHVLEKECKMISNAHIFLNVLYNTDLHRYLEVLENRLRLKRLCNAVKNRIFCKSIHLWHVGENSSELISGKWNWNREGKNWSCLCDGITFFWADGALLKRLSKLFVQSLCLVSSSL